MERRKFFALTLGAAGAAAVTVAGVSYAASTDATSADAAATSDTAIEPAYGAGLFDVDPDQSGLSQDPNTAVTGDVTALSEDMEL